MNKLLEIINDWDPLDFFPLAPKDEYAGEAQKIYEYIRGNHNLQVEHLATVINKIFVAAFGADAYEENMEKCTEVARRILIYRNEIV